MKTLDVLEQHFSSIDKLKDPAGWLDVQYRLGAEYMKVMKPFRKRMEHCEMIKLAHEQAVRTRRLNRLGEMTKKQLIEIIMR